MMGSISAPAASIDYVRELLRIAVDPKAMERELSALSEKTSANAAALAKVAAERETCAKEQRAVQALFSAADERERALQDEADAVALRAAEVAAREQDVAAKEAAVAQREAAARQREANAERTLASGMNEVAKARGEVSALRARAQADLDQAAAAKHGAQQERDELARKRAALLAAIGE